MKKKFVIISGIIILILIVATSIILINNNSNNNDFDKFKNEYESLNDKVDSQNRKYMKVEVPDTDSIKYSDYEEIFDIIENKTGIIYFGFPECPWCRNIIKPLIEVIVDNDIETLYYFNNSADRDIKSLDDNNNIVNEKQGTENYYKLLDLLNDHLGSYQGLNDENIKRLYYPTVVFVKDGNIEGVHIDTVESHSNGRDLLNEEQKDELKEIYQNYIDKTYGGICDETC